MSSLKSEYTIDLQINDDKSKDAVRALEKSLKGIGKAMSLEESKKAAQAMIDKFHEMARDQDLDFQTISKSYSKNAAKAIGELEKQYAGLKDELDSAKSAYESNERQIREMNERLKDGNMALDERSAIYRALNDLEEQQRNSKYRQLEAQIHQNRLIRANLKAAEQSARMERANAKYEKLKELQAKRKLTSDNAERKAIDEKIKQQKAYIKAIELAEKAQKDGVKQQEAMTKAIRQSTQAESKFRNTVKAVGGVLHGAYNAAGLAGGAARTAKAAVGAGIGIAQGIGTAVSMVAGGAEQEVERERQANRIKGFGNLEERVEILRQIYVRTGADYGVIVDAINRVQGILGKSISKDELVSAAGIEIRYPGMSQAFASEGNGADVSQFQRHANRMRAIQKATGASDEQIQASTQMIANMRPGNFGNASSTELQAVYLGLQNSGAFDSQEELDMAFNGFVRNRRDSKASVFDDAQKYDWSRHAVGARNRTQAESTLKNMDWSGIGGAMNRPGEDKPQEMSKSEQMAMKMREIEDKKNQLLMKLIPAVLPVVDGIAKLMDSKGDKIVKGLVSLFETVIPMLEPVFDALGVFLEFMSNTILPGIQKLVKTVVDWFGDDSNQEESSLPKKANGGIVWGKSIIGERGPEAVIPLDYSRSQRAENIAYSIQNNFSMSGNETTALSLAQAVSSRDFSRAMGKAAFKAGRLGAF